MVGAGVQRRTGLIEARIANAHKDSRGSKGGYEVGDTDTNVLDLSSARGRAQLSRRARARPRDVDVLPAVASTRPIASSARQPAAAQGQDAEVQPAAYD
jgi:hypothetical protein